MLKGLLTGGYNIWPAELENIIASHADVIEVAVFGIPHPPWGETSFAVCVVKPDSTLTEAEVVSMVKEALGSYKNPGGVNITQTPLPKSPVGKIKRKDLREPYWEGVERRVSGS